MGQQSEKRGPEIYIVSGLPRSGTSMAMRMLEAGGIEACTDRQRQADADNPKGYFEYEAVKQLKSDTSWVAQAQGKALKVISQLLGALPAGLTYRVVFMQRSLDEVLRSQAAMLLRRGLVAPSAAEDEQIKTLFTRHLLEVEAWLQRQENMQCLFVPHGGVLQEPSVWAERINRFAGGGLDSQAMAAVVDPDLYRQRQP